MPRKVQTQKINKVDLVKKAITSLLKGRQELNISGIANRAGISRPTIYNSPELLQICVQAITAQKQALIATKELASGTEDISITKSPLEEANDKIRDLENKYRKLLIENARLQTELFELKKIIFSNSNIKPLPRVINPISP